MFEGIKFQVFKLILSIFFFSPALIKAQELSISGRPMQLDIRKVSSTSARITLKPLSFKMDFPGNPSLSRNLKYGPPDISIFSTKKKINKNLGDLNFKITFNPLRILISNNQGQKVQDITFEENGTLNFITGNQPVLGLGEGGPKPKPKVNWRKLPVQFDRRNVLDSMQPRWQSDAYGSRNPAPVLIGTAGWGLFVAAPWVLVDLRNKDYGKLIPYSSSKFQDTPQTQSNQGLNQGKGLPPSNAEVKGLMDFFVFDSHDPKNFLKDYSTITGPATMPPKWALGYMQSHRTLKDEDEMIAIVDTFRNKNIPLDAVIYLGTGFTPRGWNKPQPSFQFNPKVFHRDPKEFIKDIHDRNVKIILHMVPWDRDKLPTLHGTIPPQQDEILDVSHIINYWSQHEGLVNIGVDGFWPDEGDWFNLFERIKRAQMYYQGSLYSSPNKRPWSLSRNGYPGIAQWGSWVWSGDTQSSWKTLEAQIAVGINYSLSIGPYWGSDIGGFYSSEETTGELYTRWFQFASFCGSFRSHGRTWHTRLPWGWGASSLGPIEDKIPPLISELNNPDIEPIVKAYDQLRYRLMPYTYTLAWEASHKGLPLMRAMWIEFPKDEEVKDMGSEYMWGEDFLIAPVFKKGAIFRKLYLPSGIWYDWWTNQREVGKSWLNYKVDLKAMPIFVRAGAIIPIAPIHQFTGDTANSSLTIKIYSGANGVYELYEDDGSTMNYLKGEASLTHFKWNDDLKKLTITPESSKMYHMKFQKRILHIELIPEGKKENVDYDGKPTTLTFKK